MMNFLLLLSLVVLSQAAFSTEIKKVFDGTQGYCPEPSEARYFDHQKMALAQVEAGQLIIKVSTCDKGSWVLDQNLKTNSYKSFNGLDVVEKYSRFVLVIRSIDETKTKIISLPDFENQSIVRISLEDLKSVDETKVDVNLQSFRQTVISNGYAYDEQLSWGATRVVLK